MQIDMIEGNGNGEHEKVLSEAALVVNQYKAERERLKKIADEATAALEETKKQLLVTQLDNEVLKANLENKDNICEELRAEAAELRGIFANIAVMVGAYEIQLPVKKREPAP